jgi:UPF0716 protein FxsA
VPLLLFLIFIVVPIVEIYVIIQVGQAIGPLWTVALLIADSILGAWLMRSQGRAAWRRFQVALSEGRAPAREVVDGALVIFGGAFLLTPGFVTDIFGVLFLIPPTRALIRRMLVRRFTFRVVSDVSNPRVRRRPAAAGNAGGFDVDGTATDITDPPRTLP